MPVILYVGVKTDVILINRKYSTYRDRYIHIYVCGYLLTITLPILS